jgi:hypothetical protein
VPAAREKKRTKGRQHFSPYEALKCPPPPPLSIT